MPVVIIKDEIPEKSATPQTASEWDDFNHLLDTYGIRTNTQYANLGMREFMSEVRTLFSQAEQRGRQETINTIRKYSRVNKDENGVLELSITHELLASLTPNQPKAL